jgi:hypothetical protein
LFCADVVLPFAAIEQGRIAMVFLLDGLHQTAAYPQGMPMMVAAASFVGGRFLESTAPVINIALLAGSSALFAEALAAALARQGRLQAGEMPLVMVACAVAVTAFLNPGLDGAVVLSSYADCGTMVATGALGLLGVQILARLSAGSVANAEALSWRFGFVAAMLVNLKQANPVLLALIMAGLAAIALRDPIFRSRRALAQLPPMLAPSIVLFAFWRWYVTQNLPNSEQAFRPIAEWNFGALRETVSSICDLIADRPLFHLMMWSVTAAGLTLFFRLPSKASEAQWLAVVCATVWLGYNLFLLIVYAGAMSRSDAQIAADYWRYTPHAALLGLYMPILALATGRWPVWMERMSLCGPAPTAAAVVLALCALPVRGDLHHPAGRDWQRFLRNAIADMRRLIPPGSKLLILSADDSSPFGVAVRYNLWQLAKPEQQILATILSATNDFAEAERWGRRGEPNYLIIQDAEDVMDQATHTFGLPPINHELVLFVFRNGTWEKLKSWSIPRDLIHHET